MDGNVINRKEFGRYRVRLSETRSGLTVFISDIKECDRTIAKIYATDSNQCFNSVTAEAITFLSSFTQTKDVESKNNFVHLLNGYIYGTIDLVSSIEWFNPHARPQC